MEFSRDSPVYPGQMSRACSYRFLISPYYIHSYPAQEYAFPQHLIHAFLAFYPLQLLNNPGPPLHLYHPHPELITPVFQPDRHPQTSYLPPGSFLQDNIYHFEVQQQQYFSSRFIQSLGYWKDQEFIRWNKIQHVIDHVFHSR